MTSTPAHEIVSDPRLRDIDLSAPGAAAKVYRIALDLDHALWAFRHTPECDLIHDRNFLDAKKKTRPGNLSTQTHPSRWPKRNPSSASVWTPSMTA